MDRLLPASGPDPSFLLDTPLPLDRLGLDLGLARLTQHVGGRPAAEVAEGRGARCPLLSPPPPRRRGGARPRGGKKGEGPAPCPPAARPSGGGADFTSALTVR